MRITRQTLLEQVRITEFELTERKALLGFTAEDEAVLGACLPIIEPQIDAIVNTFYEAQTRIREVALLIGDADTLRKLHVTQQQYVLGLFGGRVDLAYVNNRLHTGMVHRRIGLEPRFYLAGVQQIMGLVRSALSSSAALEPAAITRALQALDKLLTFDATLFFDSYLRALTNDFGAVVSRAEEHTRQLESALHERTLQLEDVARGDALTGLINRRHLGDALAQSLSAAQRRGEPLSLTVFDIDHFQLLNDTRGHQHGDDILRSVGKALATISRIEDSCFRYGGDEFCVILPNCGEAEAMNLFCRRLLDHLAQTLPDVTLSVGICSTGPQHYLAADELLSRADASLHQAKLLTPDPDSGFMPEESSVDLRRLMQRGNPSR
jgi:diguanylate cyclase (GGDEF)-like protein